MGVVLYFGMGSTVFSRAFGEWAGFILQPIWICGDAGGLAPTEPLLQSLPEIQGRAVYAEVHWRLYQFAARLESWEPL